MANILGIHFGHDGGVCLIKGNKLICAISSERITRKKKFNGVTDEIISLALKEGGLQMRDISVVTFSEFFKENSGNIKLIQNDSELTSFSQRIFGNDILKENLVMEIRGVRIPAIAIPHHLAHAAAAFYTSKFQSAHCFSLDSSMGYLAGNSFVGFGDGNRLTALDCPKLMVGVAYAAFTHRLGLGHPVFKAGSTMGLASYGKVLPLVRQNINDYSDRCFFDQELTYDQRFKKFWNEMGAAEDFFSPSKKDSRQAMDIAASLQYIFEESILKAIKKIDFKVPNLCLSGGSMLNVNTNSRILKETRYKNIHLFPGVGDDGICVGCALYVAHHLFRESRYNYSEREIAYLGLAAESEMKEIDYSDIASEISNGKIVAWFNGRSEYGPRALGHRSILADPRNFHSRELLNFVVKKREWFRPFAPVVLEEKRDDWFDFPTTSPYMLFTAPVKNPKEVPSIVHIDGSARMQTINENMDKDYYNLIKAFEFKTGIPMLINTSLNGDGEPILETEEDGMRFFEKSACDILVLNGKIFRK